MTETLTERVNYPANESSTNYTAANGPDYCLVPTSPSRPVWLRLNQHETFPAKTGILSLDRSMIFGHRPTAAAVCLAVINTTDQGYYQSF